MAPCAPVEWRLAAAMAGVPSSLRPIGHYTKIANDFRERDPVVYYWCLLYAVQAGMKLDKSDPACKQYLGQLLGALEEVKKQLKHMEAITQELVAQAHIEQVALKLFAHADAKDRASDFSRNTVRTFYTAGYLMDVLNLFPELDEKIEEARKYAKWKAAYLNNCLKTGETPVAGPPPAEDDDVPAGGDEPSIAVPPPGLADAAHAGPSVPAAPPASSASAAAPLVSHDALVSPGAAAADLTLQDWEEAKRLCKYAVSAMQYEDGPAAVDNLTKALKVLTTHK